MAFDFPNAQIPALTPLEKSYAQNAVEADLKRLFIDLYDEHLAEAVFDINVSGARHLGSFDLVRQSVNAEGLVLLQGDREEAATRYLYRAWATKDLQGRGLHFLRTYLQLLFPNVCRVEQMWQKKDAEYPYALYTVLDEPDVEINPETMWLTSRVQIALDLSIQTRNITALTNIIKSITPARFIPQFLFWLIFDCTLSYSAWYSLAMAKAVEVTFWQGVLLITERVPAKWRLSKENAANPIRLKSGRIQSWADTTKVIAIDVPIAGVEAEIIVN